jgi:hypothetical protein
VLVHAKLQEDAVVAIEHLLVRPVDHGHHVIPLSLHQCLQRRDLIIETYRSSSGCAVGRLPLDDVGNRRTSWREKLPRQ